MDPKTERIVTIAVIIIVATLMVGIIAVLMMENNGSMDEDTGFVALAFLSTSLTTVVILFGAIYLSGSRSEEYQRYVEEMERREKE